MEFELKNIATYQSKNKLFDLHLTIASEINKNYKSKLYKDIIEHEQDILLGEDSKGNELNFDELYQRFIEIKQKIRINGQKNDIIRILMTYLYGFNVTQNQFNEMINDLSETEKKVFNGLNLLNLECSENLDNKPYKRNMLEFNCDKNDLKNMKYSVLRAKNKIVSIIEDCTRNNLNEEEFQFVEEPENIKYRSKGIKKKKLNKFEEVAIDPDYDVDNLKDINKGEISQLLIYFNIGGLSINEISLIRNLSKNNELGFKIILGSTGVYSSNQYLKELISMMDNQDNEDIIDEKEEENIIEEDIKEDKKLVVKKQKNDINIEIANKIDNAKEDDEFNEERVKLEVKEDEKENNKNKKDKKGKDSHKKDKNDKKKDKKNKKKEKEKEKEKKKKAKVKNIKNESDDDKENDENED
jgi:hypothetical protein